MRRWVIAGLVLLVLLGAGAYYLYIVGPDSAVQRAEAFRFRRMTVAQLAEGGPYRFHFVTNRTAGGERETLDGRFTNERTSTPTFGHFDTSIEPSLGLGALINPTSWFQTEEIVIDEVTDLERDAFVAHLKSRVEASPRRSLLVLVHGFRTSFPLSLSMTAFIAHVLDLNSPVLVFDWPADQGSSLRGYRRAQGVAEASGAELAETLRLVISDVQPERLWVLANSMGAQVVADAFGLLYEDSDLADAETEIENVVLTAPDIDYDEFNERFKLEINALARDLAVYVSSNDRALLVSRLINRSPRAGESTLTSDQFEQAVRFTDLIEPGAERVALVDVTPVNRTRNFHNFSLETPEFYDNLFLRLTSSSMPQTRLSYRVTGADGKHYWVLTRGR